MPGTDSQGGVACRYRGHRGTMPSHVRMSTRVVGNSQSLPESLKSELDVVAVDCAGRRDSHSGAEMGQHPRCTCSRDEAGVRSRRRDSAVAVLIDPCVEDRQRGAGALGHCRRETVRRQDRPRGADPMVEIVCADADRHRHRARSGGRCHPGITATESSNSAKLPNPRIRSKRPDAPTRHIHQHRVAEPELPDRDCAQPVRRRDHRPLIGHDPTAKCRQQSRPTGRITFRTHHGEFSPHIEATRANPYQPQLRIGSGARFRLRPQRPCADRQHPSSDQQ